MLLKLILLSWLSYKILNFRNIHLKLLLFVLYYPLIVLFFANIGLPMVGLFEIYKDYFSIEIVEVAFWSYCIGFLLVLIIINEIKELPMSFYYIDIGNNVRFLLLFFLLLSAIPIVYTHGSSIIGTKSSSFYVSFAVFLLMSHKSRDLIWFLHIVICLSLILIGERVDSIMQLLYLFFIKNDNRSLDYRFTIKHLFLGILLFSILVFVRANDNFDINTLISSFVSQQTVCDVTYIYLTGIDYFYEMGSNFDVLKCLITGWLPGGGITSDNCFTNILREYMPNMGGGLFFTEGAMILGPIGVCIYMAIYGFVLKFLFVSKNIFFKVLFVLSFVMMCRFCWYGYLYTFKPILLVLFFAIIFKNNFLYYEETKKYSDNK